MQIKQLFIAGIVSLMIFVRAAKKTMTSLKLMLLLKEPGQENIPF